MRWGDRSRSGCGRSTVGPHCRNLWMDSQTMTENPALSTIAPSIHTDCSECESISRARRQRTVSGSSRGQQQGDAMLGAVADDFTGATDLAMMLRASGHRVVVAIEDAQLSPEQLASVDAVVVALKTRTAPVADAVARSRAAIERLQGWGATRFYVKYCSTFDSTDRGNIGPVLDAAREMLGAERCVVVPSLPANGRRVRDGLLFVHEQLLEDSPMRHHPLTPMTRSRVAELLAPQTTGAVAEIHRSTILQGAGALREALAAETASYVVLDTETDEDLATIGAATADDVLVSGGSGLALGIPGPSGGA